MINVNSTLDHVSFSAVDKKDFMETLTKNNITFKERYIPEINIEQLFLRTQLETGLN